MAPPSWATQDQDKLLWGYREDYSRAQAGKMVWTDLWDNIMAEWGQHWPVLKEVFPDQDLQFTDLTAAQLTQYQTAYNKLKSVSQGPRHRIASRVITLPNSENQELV